MQKAHKFKSIKYRNWVSIGLSNPCYFLVQYMLPVTMKMEFFGEGSQISSMRVFYATLIGLFVWWSYFISNRILYRIGNKPVMAIVQNRQLEQGLT
jgi:K(+)-stimulated pyrophosphate-energized sodium pump